MQQFLDQAGYLDREMDDETNSRHNGRNLNNTYIHGALHNIISNMLRHTTAQPPMNHLTPHNNTDTLQYERAHKTEHHRRPDPVGRLTPQA